MIDHAFKSRDQWQNKYLILAYQFDYVPTFINDEFIIVRLL